MNVYFVKTEGIYYSYSKVSDTKNYMRLKH